VQEGMLLRFGIRRLLCWCFKVTDRYRNCLRRFCDCTWKWNQHFHSMACKGRNLSPTLGSDCRIPESVADFNWR